MIKRLIVFDLDGTLAESKSSLDPEMSALIHDLLGIVKVAVISGGDWLQFEKQVLSGLPHDKSLDEPVNPSYMWNKILPVWQGNGKRYIQKILPMMKKRKLSVH